MRLVRCDRLRSFLAFASSVIGHEPVDLLLDLVKPADALERLFGDRRAIGGVHIEEVAPDVGPTGGLEDAIAGEQLVEAGIPVGMDRAAELFQVSLRMLPFSIRRVEEQRSGWARTGEWPLVADVGP